jgi:hypothetical protein
MAKIKAVELAAELDIDTIAILAIVDEHVPKTEVTGKGRNTWLTPEAVSIVKEQLQYPELIPKYYMGKVTHEAPNPNYVYAYIKELSKRVPVVIARKFKGKLLEKTIKIEEITDNAGSSFRYVQQRHNT